MAPRLLMGPMLRGEQATMTVWMELDGPATVEVLGRRAATFRVADHHYAVVDLAGLPPGTDQAYDVRIDGARVWPPTDWGGPPRIRTWDQVEPYRIVAGSCRQSAPHAEPWDTSEIDDNRGMGPDALLALADEFHAGRRPWPHLLILGGDQVYADEPHPSTAEAVERRRPGATPSDRPAVTTFEEYTWLYQATFDDPRLQQLLATVPSMMIFDDHDIIDDWNISEAWHRQVSQLDWWDRRVRSGLMAYWVYQHLGNLSMDELRRDQLFLDVTDAEDGEAVLREFATRAEAGTPGRGGYRWSYRRDAGPCRLVVVDSRNGRVLEEDSRSMLDEDEWAWLEHEVRYAREHLLVVTSVPWLLPPALHKLEALDEVVCGGAWGELAARAGEWVRQAIDLEHWAAFGRSFVRLNELLGGAGGGHQGVTPPSVTVLSGDLHFGYVAELEVPGGGRVTQVVTSPLRQASELFERRVQRWAISRPASWLLTRLLHLAPPRSAAPYDWKVDQGPWFDNNVATFEFTEDHARVTIEAATLGGDGECRLTRLAERALKTA